MSSASVQNRAEPERSKATRSGGVVVRRHATANGWASACRVRLSGSAPRDDGRSVVPSGLRLARRSGTIRAALKMASLRSRPSTDFRAARSAEGVANLAGNAAEWVADFYDPTVYKRMVAEDPPKLALGGLVWRVAGRIATCCTPPRQRSRPS